jgi:hypothetical protein
MGSTTKVSRYLGQKLILPLICCALWVSFVASLAGMPLIDFHGFHIDRLGLLMATFFLTVVTLIQHYDLRAFYGETLYTSRTRAFILIGVFGLVLSIADAAWLVVLTWVSISSVLARLQRPVSLKMPLRPHGGRALTTQRIGDIAIVSLVVFIYTTTNAINLTSYFAALSMQPALYNFIAGLLLSIAVCSRAGIYPFHAWLPKSATDVTPTAALVQAAIVTTGGFLLLRFAPLVAYAKADMALLALLAGGTALWGIATMRVQPDERGRITAATMAHMGYVTFLSAFGCFPGAVLHLIANSGSSLLKTLAITNQEPRDNDAFTSHLFALRRSAIAIAASAFAFVLLLHTPLMHDLPATLFLPMSFAVLTTAQITRSLTDGEGRTRDALASILPLITLSCYLVVLLSANTLMSPMNFSTTLTLPAAYAIPCVAIAYLFLMIAWHATAISQAVRDRTYVWLLQRRMPLLGADRST